MNFIKFDPDPLGFMEQFGVCFLAECNVAA